MHIKFDGQVRICMFDDIIMYNTFLSAQLTIHQIKRNLYNRSLSKSAVIFTYLIMNILLYYNNIFTNYTYLLQML